MTFSIPLYNVLTPYGDEADATDVSMRSAKSYARALDTSGIPATIVYSRSVTVDEYLSHPN